MPEKSTRMLSREETKAIHSDAMTTLGLNEDDLLPQHMSASLLSLKKYEKDEKIEEQAHVLLEKIRILGLSDFELKKTLWRVAGGLWTYATEEREKRHDGNYKSIYDLRSDVVYRVIVNLVGH